LHGADSCGIPERFGGDYRDGAALLYGRQRRRLPRNGLIADSAGNLYGTTSGGGASYKGVVFKLAPDGTETVLHSFPGFPSDGNSPYAGLIADSAGNLYGTTLSRDSVSHAGVVFKLAPNGTAGWTETVLHSFTGFPTDGALPYAGLIADSAGNLYGATTGGGASGQGVVFKLAPDGTETVLHAFTGGSDGAYPGVGPLIADSAGNLYGTTTGGGGGPGASGQGVVFKLSPDGTETVLHSFTLGSGGGGPLAGLIADSAGNLYGTTQVGGASGQGVVFKLAPNGTGGWTESVLYSFTGGSDGGQPFYGSLIADGAGNLYGTTVGGGASGAGVVFKLSGTGFVTTTLANVPPSQVVTTAYGLAYSRVTQTFNGTVTIRNISSTGINGPFQIVLTSLSAGVALVNATGTVDGMPYLTVPITSLAPSQSATVNLLFKNPSNAKINFTPVIHAGSLN